MRPKSIALAARAVATAMPIACFCFGASAQTQDTQAAAASATAASAPTADASGATELEKVVVTARKREERGQDVPQSLNVISGLALESSGVSAFEQLQYKLPGVAAVSGPGNQIAIRGVSNNANQRGGGPSTAVHLDGVYLPRPELALGEVFDLGRVEVLKGPEGTLYGRNATAGVVNYISRDPGQGSGFDGFVGVGTDHLVRAQAGVNLHFGDTAAFRISAASTKDDGYTENLNAAGGHIDARNFQAARIKGAFQLADGIEAKLTAQFVDDKGTVGYGVSGNPLTLNYANSLNPPQRESVRRIETDTPPDVHRRGSILSLQLTADLGGGIELKSITGYVKYDSRNLYDADGTGGFIERTGGNDKSDFWSQEFQLSGGSARGLSWTTGAYFSHEKTSGSTTVEDSMSYPDDLTPFTYYTGAFNAKSRSGAVFGELSYALNEQWTLVGGARYTKEKLSGDSRGADIDFDTFEMVPFSGSGSTSSGRFTPKALVQYRPSKDHMLYASVTAGFKSGGVNFNPPIKTYKPEKITAYELGSKSVLLGGALEMDLAGFYYDYTDLQLRTVVGNQAPISNVAKATVKGVEMAFVGHPTRDLSLDLNMAYVDSALKDYLSPATGTDLSGMPLPLSPKFSGTAGAQYRVGLGHGDALTLRAEVNRQTSVIFPALQNPSVERRGPITLVNANIRYSFADRKTWLALIGRNLGNKTYMTNRNYSAGFADVETYAAPRTVEVRLGSSF